MNDVFPQFRKINSTSYYKILSNTEMIEIQILGNKILKHRLKTETYFERAFILDLLSTDHGRYQVCTRFEFEEIEASGK